MIEFVNKLIKKIDKCWFDSKTKLEFKYGDDIYKCYQNNVSGEYSLYKESTMSITDNPDYFIKINGINSNVRMVVARTIALDIVLDNDEWVYEKG